MKTALYFFTKKALLLGFLLLAFAGNAQHFTVTLANLTNTANTLEVDIVLIVDAPTAGVKLCSLSTGINYNPAILNGGTPCTEINCGSWDYIPGTRSTALLPLSVTSNTTKGPTTASPTTAYGHLRIVHPNIYTSPVTSVNLLPGTYTLGRYRFTNTVPWTAHEDAQLWLQPNNSNPFGNTNTIVCFYNMGTTTPFYAYTTTEPAGGTGLTLGYTESTPMLRILNPGLSTVENTVNLLQAAPNPFSTAFNLSFETISNEPITVKVYDMIGKLIENRGVEANAINTMQLGGNYQAGIYNVIVSQGEKVQNIRVIKK